MNDIKLTQEKWNWILDINDRLGKTERSLTEVREHLRRAQLEIKELKSSKDGSAVYNDFFDNLGKK